MTILWVTRIYPLLELYGGHDNNRNRKCEILKHSEFMSDLQKWVE